MKTKKTKQVKVGKIDVEFDNGYCDGYEEQPHVGKSDEETLLKAGMSKRYIEGYNEGWEDSLNKLIRRNEL